MGTLEGERRYSIEILSLPLEILDLIAFELTATNPLGPPSAIVPLLLTCSTIHHRLSPRHNRHLWAKIFCDRFDSSAVKRRAFRPSDTQYVEQLQTYCTAMRRLRTGSIFFGCLTSDLSEDTSLEDALKTGIIMMLENDGRNECQLLYWAFADRLVSLLVRKRLYDDSNHNSGWPLENARNACALTLMWLLTSEESLNRESTQEREHIMATIFPFVSIPFRYPCSEAPPNLFSLPFPSRSASLPVSLETAHGPYPVFPPSNRISLEPHYGSRPAITVPLVAPAAKLLYFARAELTRLAIPSHMAVDRAAWLARGNVGTAPTGEDIDEFNWGWKVRLPLGPGSGRTAFCSTSDSFLGERNPFGSFVDDEGIEEANSNRTASPCKPKWAGKAPHSTLFHCGTPRSRQWDADWWRLRLCSDPFTPRTRIPYGPVFEIGSLNGLWQGYYMVPDERRLSSVLASPEVPSVPLEEALRTTIYPIFLKLREAHSLRSRPSVNLGTHSQTFGSMNNAWFDGLPGTTEFRSAGSSASGDSETVEVLAAGRKETCTLWNTPIHELGTGQGFGNDAFRFDRNEVDEGGDSQELGSKEWPGYPHESWECDECVARAAARQQIELERAFASVGLGVEHSDGNSDVDLDSSIDELEPGQPEWTDSDGNVYSPIFPSIDRTKLATSHCDGVREVYCFGESDPRHADAWGSYRFYGRVRRWDGLVAILRCPEVVQDEDEGMILLYGYITGGNVFTGNWRSVGVHEGMPGWEGPFVMSKRED